jgi:hypothetical protein
VLAGFATVVAIVVVLTIGMFIAAVDELHDAADAVEGGGTSVVLSLDST